MSRLEFQVYSVSLEDRLPRCIPKDADISDEKVLSVSGMDVTTSKEGCCALVFGRTEAGKTVCARVEGFHPKLYFNMDNDSQEHRTSSSRLSSLTSELRKEVRYANVKTKEMQFCHAYGYEPDDESPSGRKIHTYAEASYPSLFSWREACDKRREQMHMDAKALLNEKKRRLKDVKQEILRIRSGLMAGSILEETDSGKCYRTMEELKKEEEVLTASVIPGMEGRVESLKGWKDKEVLPTSSSFSSSSSGRLRQAEEYFVDPMTRFLYETGITPSKWISCPFVLSEQRMTSCNIEVDCHMNSLLSVQKEEDAPYVTLYYDIETLGLDPLKAGIIQVSLVFVQEGKRERHLIALGSVSSIANVKVHSCQTETELLITWKELIRTHDPDFLVAYNGVKFDNHFLCTRANILGEEALAFFYTSRVALRPAKEKVIALASSGMGENKIQYMDMTGRVNLDFFVILKRDLTSEPCYTLNHFATKFCGLQKEDVHYSEIPILQKSGPEGRARLGKYCVMDSELLEDINQAQTIILKILQFSSTFGILPEWVYYRGQQVRYVSLLLKKVRTCEEFPLLMNRPLSGFFGEGSNGFQGATVNDPHAGFFEDPVATLDWLSLYPSIMRAYNLCPSTHVLDASLQAQEGVVRYEPGGGIVAHFVTSSRKKGILPRILEELATERTAAKKRMKEQQKRVKDLSLPDSDRNKASVLAKVWDGRQLALKVSMNSVYGACADTRTGKYPDLAVSATVTSQGREAMVIKKKILPERFPGIRILYGDTDSVMVQFAGVKTVEEACEKGEEAADFVTSHFASLGYPDMVLEFEKCYCPYLQEGKKRYAGLKHEVEGGKVVVKGVDCKGLETERRDTLPFVKEIMTGCLDILMFKKDVAVAVRFFQTKMDEFVAGKVDFNKFIMRKNLSSKVEGKTETIAHARVNALRKMREPGSEAATNEQVEYVIVCGHKNEKTTQLAEDPEYVKKNNIPLNKLWYFEHAIRDPIQRLFAPCSLQQIDIKNIFRNYSSILNGKRLKVGSSLADLLSSAPVDSDEEDGTGGPKENPFLALKKKKMEQQ